eukprot:4850811-Amphidinium_carterae.1
MCVGPLNVHWFHVWFAGSTDSAERLPLQVPVRAEANVEQQQRAEATVEQQQQQQQQPPKVSSYMSAFADKARAENIPEVENGSHLLAAILTEAEVCSMPVQNPAALKTIAFLTEEARKINEITTAEEISKQGGAWKDAEYVMTQHPKHEAEWGMALSQLTKALGKANEDAKKHVKQVERAKAVAEKREREEKEKQAVAKAGKAAKELAEKHLLKPDPKAPVLEKVPVPMKANATFVEIDVHTELEKFMSASWAFPKILQSDGFQVLAAQPAVQKTLASWANNHKKVKG